MGVLRSEQTPSEVLQLKNKVKNLEVMLQKLQIDNEPEPEECKDLLVKHLKVPLDVRVDKENSLESSFIWSIYLYTILLVCALLFHIFM